MENFKQEKLKDFTIIRNSIFRDKKLSAKAKGVACTLLSLPPTWNYSVHGLVGLFSDGESSIRSALTELENAGYLRRERVKNQGKFGGAIYIITDTLKCEKPNVENPLVDNAVVENQAQLNTKELNTNKSTTKNNKRFTPPSMQEVQEYIDEKGYSVDAERFIDYYTANGWMVGKNHMKDWKATVRNWERNNGNDIRAGGNQSRGLRERNGDRKADNERVATGFIPMANGIPYGE